MGATDGLPLRIFWAGGASGLVLPTRPVRQLIGCSSCPLSLDHSLNIGRLAAEFIWDINKNGIVHLGAKTRHLATSATSHRQGWRDEGWPYSHRIFATGMQPPRCVVFPRNVGARLRAESFGFISDPHFSSPI